VVYLEYQLDFLGMFLNYVKITIALLIGSLSFITSLSYNVYAQEIVSEKVGDPLFIYFEGCGVGTKLTSLNALTDNCASNTYLTAWIENPRDMFIGGIGDNIYVKINNGEDADQFYKIPFNIFSKACLASAGGGASIVNDAGFFGGRNYYISDDCKNEGNNLNNIVVNNSSDFIRLIRATYESENQTPVINTDDGITSDTLNAVAAAESDDSDIFAIILSVILGLLLIFVALITSLVWFIVNTLASAALFLIRFNPAADYLISSIEPLWQVMVNVANLAILAGFVTIGVGLIAGLKDFKGNQKTVGFLSGLIAIAVLANFSLSIAATAVNLTQTAGDLFVAAVVLPANPEAQVVFDPLADESGREAIAETNSLFVDNIIQPFGSISPIRDSDGNLQAVWDNVTDLDVTTSNILGELIFLGTLVFLLLIFFSAFRISIFRLAWLVILMVTSPLALAAYFSPIGSFKKMGETWFKKFIGIAPLYPILIIGLYFASYMAGQVGQLTSQVGGIQGLNTFYSDLFTFNGAAINNNIASITISITLTLLGPALAIVILWLIFKYLDDAFKSHAGAVGNAILGGAAGLVGGGVGVLTGLAAGTVAGGVGLANGGKGRTTTAGRVWGSLTNGATKFGQTFDRAKAFGDDIGGVLTKPLSEGASPDMANIKKNLSSVQDFFKKRSDVRSQYNKDMWGGTAELAGRGTVGLLEKFTGGPNAVSEALRNRIDDLNPSSKFAGQVGASAKDFFNMSAAARSKYDKGRGKSSEIADTSVKKYAERLNQRIQKNPNLSFNQISGDAKNEVLQIAEKMKSNPSVANTVATKNKEFHDWIAGNMESISTQTGDDFAATLLEKSPSLLFSDKLADMSKLDIAQLQKDHLEAMEQDPKKYNDVAAEVTPDYRRRVKEHMDNNYAGTYAEFNVDAGAKTPFVFSEKELQDQEEYLKNNFADVDSAEKERKALEKDTSNQFTPKMVNAYKKAARNYKKRNNITGRFTETQRQNVLQDLSDQNRDAVPQDKFFNSEYMNKKFTNAITSSQDSHHDAIINQFASLDAKDTQFFSTSQGGEVANNSSDSSSNTSYKTNQVFPENPTGRKQKSKPV